MYNPAYDLDETPTECSAVYDAPKRRGRWLTILKAKSECGEAHTFST